MARRTSAAPRLQMKSMTLHRVLCVAVIALWGISPLVTALLPLHSSLARVVDESHSDSFAAQYTPFTREQREAYRWAAKDMFTFGYDSYMKWAWPMDELDPIHCEGRGPDVDRPDNININDVLGDFSLTAVDSLGTLAVMGNVSEFHAAVRRIIAHVSFDKNHTVQVFEANIRVLGSLLSAHLLLTDETHLVGELTMSDYNGELLSMAHDLAARLLPAFSNTSTGIPHPRVNLMTGVPEDGSNTTCTAGAGSLLLEFGVLSRLLDDPTYEQLARRTNKALWRYRDATTGLIGSVIDIQTAEWQNTLSGLGAGIDSYYEYLLKAYILFGQVDDYHMFNQSYHVIRYIMQINGCITVREHMRKGRVDCTSGSGEPPLYVNVHMKDGSTANTWIDSLQASFAGVQILNGDVSEAICQHALYYSIWSKYGALPERFNWKLKAPDVSFYPLRPEFAEATYLLYMATKNTFYLHVGAQIIDSLNDQTRAECGYGTVHDVHTGVLEDRMESFFLSETCKYLYLLFDEHNPVNRNYERLLFSTEGHIFPINDRLRVGASLFEREGGTGDILVEPSEAKRRVVDRRRRQHGEGEEEMMAAPMNRSQLVASEAQCETQERHSRFALPLQSNYMRQLFDLVGLHWSH